MIVETIQAARKRLDGHAHATPVLTSATLDKRLDAHVYFKCENFQKTGAFKFRGAFNSLSRLSRPARAVMVGAGELAGEVDALAARLGLPDFTRLDGLPPSETLACMARARILVMTSRWEGLPTVAIEAVQSGSLVAGYAIPPLESILGETAAHALTPPRPEALAARLDVLLDDEPGRAALAAELSGRARARFSPDRMAARYAELYARARAC